MHVAYPKSTTEQAKIAEILMQWDKAIELQKQKDYEIRELIYESAGSRQQATACIRKLLDAGEIYYKTPTLLALRH